MLDASRYLKSSILSSLSPAAVFYYQRHQAWELKVVDRETADKIANRAHKDLLPKTRLTASDQYLHHRKLYVSYPGGSIEREGVPEKQRSTEKSDLKRQVLRKGEDTFGPRGIRLSGSEGAYKLTLLPVRKEFRGRFPTAQVSAATLEELDRLLDVAIAKVEPLLRKTANARDTFEAALLAQRVANRFEASDPLRL